MNVCTLRRYYSQVYCYFYHLEFEPSGSAVAPNPRSFKNNLLKWLLWLKNHVSNWMDKIISEAVFTREKKMFCSIKASGWGACSTGEHEHMADWWMLAFRLPCILLAWLSAVSSFELILKVLKISMLLVEIPDLKPLHAFGIPIVIQLTPNNSNTL